MFLCSCVLVDRTSAASYTASWRFTLCFLVSGTCELIHNRNANCQQGKTSSAETHTEQILTVPVNKTEDYNKLIVAHVVEEFFAFYGVHQCTVTWASFTSDLYKDYFIIIAPSALSSTWSRLFRFNVNAYCLKWYSVDITYISVPRVYLHVLFCFIVNIMYFVSR